MLEIILLFYLAGQIGRIATKKGVKPGRWKLYMVLAWILFEFVGILISMVFFHSDNLLLMEATGLVFAFGGFLFVKFRLERLPDKNDDWLEQIGNQQT